MSGELVAVDGLRGGYDADDPVLSELSFAARGGEAIAVLGPNGGGKTTLFRALLGELPVCQGTVRLAARPAYVAQSERSRLDFPVNALDVVLMGAYARTRWYRRVSARDRAAARTALERLGLGDHARQRYGTLSGGQRQRVLLARALAQESPVLLLDEPLTGVDRVSAERILALFDELRAEGRALLIATHDIAQARALDRVLLVNRRQIAFGPPRRALTVEALEQTYGREIVDLDGRRVVSVDRHS